jgi:hypothetical protein
MLSWSMVRARGTFLATSPEKGREYPANVYFFSLARDKRMGYTQLLQLWLDGTGRYLAYVQWYLPLDQRATSLRLYTDPVF